MAWMAGRGWGWGGELVPRRDLKRQGLGEKRLLWGWMLREEHRGSLSSGPGTSDLGLRGFSGACCVTMSRPRPQHVCFNTLKWQGPR